jgi:hypothetical protein
MTGAQINVAVADEYSFGAHGLRALVGMQASD